MMNDLLTNLAQFHFIRPQWLWGLAVVLVLWLLLGALKKHTRWEAYFDRSKLEALKVSGGRFSHHSRWLLLTGWILATLAAAGPTWQQVPTPTVRDQSAMVILLDLSPSMMAEDLSPNRLTRAKYKLIDILRQRVDGQTALVAYAGDPHTVSPLTDDASTIEALLPALEPSIMPEPGSNTEAAVELGMTLLRDAGLSQGQLLLITDGVAPEAQRYIRDNLGSNFSLSILGVGTTDAVPIPQEGGGFVRDTRGGLVTTRLNRDELQLLASVLRGNYVEIQADDSDIQYLLQEDSASPASVDETTSDDRLYDIWEDMGYWLLLLILPFFAWHFRRGALFALPLFILMPEQSQALSWKDLWQTPDQQGQNYMEQGEPEAAAEAFENPDWKASAHYRAGNYDQAAEGFAGSTDEQSLYNRGNALALQQDFEDALEAYNRILEQNPDHEDAAYNKSVIEQLMQQQQQNQQQSGDQGQNQQDQSQEQQGQQPPDQQGQSGDQSDESQEGGQESPDQQQGEQQNAEQSDQQAPQDNPSDAESGTPEEQQNQEAEAQAQEEARQALNEAAEQAEAGDSESSAVQAIPGEATPDQMQDASEQWLRSIPDDPSGLLRRKFEYESQQNRLEQRYMLQAPGSSNEERY
jgi:Ca-activated chloride channel family protein